MLIITLDSLKYLSLSIQESIKVRKQAIIKNKTI